MGKRQRPEYAAKSKATPTALPPTASAPTCVEVKHGAFCYTDEYLAKIGGQITSLKERELDLTRQIDNLLASRDGVRGAIADFEEKMKARIARISEKPLHTLPRTKQPNAEQRQALTTFALVLANTNVAMLTGVYNLVKQTKAHETNWTTDAGENVDVAYARRKKELEGATA